jgi:alpha-beta hydrolase superfamily lysophospholipase
MSVLGRAGLALERRVAWGVRKARARPGITHEELTLRSSKGLQIAAHLHRPAAPNGAAVLLCPGIEDAGSVFDTLGSPLAADEVAALGAVVLHFDPAGRGLSWGAEDHGGDVHQDDVAVAFGYLSALPGIDRVGIVAVSQGSAMAIAAVARMGLDARWILDWEGPSDRDTLTACGTKMAPADGHLLDDDAYWIPREPVRHVSNLRCPYVRLQADPDHAQPGETRHAMRMIEAASSGVLPWFQINDHPRNERPPRANWLMPGVLTANRALLRKIRTLMDTER